MLPTDNTKRLMLHRHLLHSRLAQQLSVEQGRQLQAPTIVSSTAAAALSSWPVIRPVPGFSRENAAGLQTQRQDSNNILQMLLVAEQEQRVKRRLREMQQQFQLQQQHQQTQQLLSRVRQQERVERCNPKASVLDVMTNGQLKMSLAPSTPAPALPCAGVSPVTRGLEDWVQKFSMKKVKAKEPIEGNQKEAVRLAEQSEESDSPSAIEECVSRKDARWQEMYEELIEYKRTHNGSCIVPRGFSENPRLASWVAEQRKQYKLMKDGRQSSITSERVELLDQVDFAWNAQEAAWVKHMTDLKSFRSQHGHCHVPLNDPRFPKLGLWVKEQRRHYTLMKQGKQSHMTEARCAELDSVRFCWDTHEATWLERLNELRTYKAQQGHCIVPTNYPQNPKLGTWIHHQRRQYKKFMDGKACHITAERIRALDSLGFVWHPRDKNSCAEPAPGDSEQQAAADLSCLDLRPRKRQRHA